MAALMAARRRRRQTTGGSIPGTSMTNPDYQALTLEGEDADSLITPGMAEESMSANVLMGTTPQPAECIKIGNMEKMMDSELKWSDRTVYLTRTELGYIALSLPLARVHSRITHSRVAIVSHHQIRTHILLMYAVHGICKHNRRTAHCYMQAPLTRCTQSRPARRGQLERRGAVASDKECGSPLI